MTRSLAGLLAIALSCLLGPLTLEPRARAAEPAEEIESRKVTIMSEGVRMSADVYSPRSASGTPLPAIIMAHGWGGTAALVEQNAQMALRVAHRGYVIQTGGIVLHDAAAELLRSHLVRKTYLDEK